MKSWWIGEEIILIPRYAETGLLAIESNLRGDDKG